ncbi:MAG: dethiobiotin synthase [Kofleriaceae bacterium]|nr:dethiobiotin synthase [Kofleriaceae bacterium]MCL4224090.1 dethiobiotin synthase [Myxococcales bacterium]
MIIAVTGTDTGVGKTYVTTRLIASLRRRGLDAIGLKPLETGWAEATSDAQALATASGRSLSATVYRTYALPAAPAVAAAAVGETIDPALLVDWCRNGAAAGLTLLEGAGGWLVPLGPGLLFADLVCELEAPVLLVAPARLGAINHTLLSAESIVRRGCRLLAIAVSVRAEDDRDLAASNLREIEARAEAPVYSVPAQLEQLASTVQVAAHL